KIVVLFSVVIFVLLAVVEVPLGEVASPPANKHQIQAELETGNRPIPEMPDLAGVYFYQGLRHYDLGQWEEAITAFKEAIRIRPDSEVTFFSLGIAYSRLEIWEEALASFTRAVEIDPDYAEAYLGIGIAFGMLGWDEVALQALEKAIRIKPKYAQAHYALGLTYLKLGDKNSALKELRILKTLDQNLADELIRFINN
ncbi:MAG: tetratricopeptide repeat protein, partial [Deltaproteobacteria bacterium]|nr:tetratricopeptide repeat protein [Deltaproteobacteria bacterium]